jgi:hypothetical protein
MKLSELRPIVKEAQRLGMKKLPREGMWHKSYMFDSIIANFYISNIELIYSNVPLSTMLNLKYMEFERSYRERYGEMVWGAKSLTVTLENNSEKTD